MIIWLLIDLIGWLILFIKNRFGKSCVFLLYIFYFLLKLFGIDFPIEVDWVLFWGGFWGLLDTFMVFL
jgi:hypothetical protein